MLGAEKDLLFPPDQVHATAWAFGTDATFFPDMGHSMMLQPGWESVARHIDGWMDANFAAPARKPWNRRIERLTWARPPQLVDG